MKLRKTSKDDLLIIEEALTALKQARDYLKAAGAPKAADYVRRALKSAEGARRHAIRADLDVYFAARQEEEEMDIERVVVVKQ